MTEQPLRFEMYEIATSAFGLLAMTMPAESSTPKCRRMALQIEAGDVIFARICDWIVE